MTLLLLLILAVVALVVTIFLVVLGVAAARRSGSGPDPLEWLVDLRSPSGKRFFPNKEAARDFVEELDEVSDQDPDRQPSG